MAGGHKSNGFTTERGRVTIVGALTSNGAFSFTPVIPGEREEDWLALLSGIRERFQPADRLEEEMVFNLALAFWQSRRLHRYEKAATRREIEDAADSERLLGSSDAMSQLLVRGVESVKAELGTMEKALGLIGLVAFAGDDEPLERADGELLLRLAAGLVLKGKTVNEAFSGLPESDWTWRMVRENLTELCAAAGKTMPWLLKTLSNSSLEELAALRKTLEDGLRGLEVNYTLANGGTEICNPIISRVQSRITKWLALLGQSKADRLGLTIIQPAGINGENGDGAFS